MGIFAEREQRPPGRMPLRDEPQRAELLWQRTLVPFQNVRGHGQREQVGSRVVQVEIIERGIAHRAHVERQVDGAATFGELTLLVRCGQPHRRPDLDPDAALVAHGRSARRVDFDHCYVAVAQPTFAHFHRRDGKDVPIVAHLGQVPQQGIVDCDVRARAVVFDAHEDQAGATMARQIVGERTDIAPDAAAIGARALALHQIRLEIVQQRL